MTYLGSDAAQICAVFYLGLKSGDLRGVCG